MVQLGRAHGEATFLVHEDERVTFEAFFRAVAALAGDLRVNGVEKGDRVAVAMRNMPEWPVAFYAAAALGAIVTPLNAWVDWPGTGIWSRGLGGQSSDRRRRASRASGRAPAALSRPEAGLRRSRT